MALIINQEAKEAILEIIGKADQVSKGEGDKLLARIMMLALRFDCLGETAKHDLHVRPESFSKTDLAWVIFKADTHQFVMNGGINNHDRWFKDFMENRPMDYFKQEDRTLTWSVNT